MYPSTSNTSWGLVFFGLLKGVLGMSTVLVSSNKKHLPPEPRIVKKVCGKVPAWPETLRMARLLPWIDRLDPTTSCRWRFDVFFLLEPLKRFVDYNLIDLGGLPKPCNCGYIIIIIYSCFLQGILLIIHYPLSHCFGRTQNTMSVVWTCFNKSHLSRVKRGDVIVTTWYPKQRLFNGWLAKQPFFM